MGKMQRLKGASFEREIVEAFRASGIVAKRGLGQARGGGAEVPDVVTGLLHVECKVGRAPDPWAALDQAERDARPGVWPVAVCKRDRRRTIVSFDLADFLELWGVFLAETGDRGPRLVEEAVARVAVKQNDGEG